MKRSAIMIVVLLSFMTISSAMGSIAAPNDVITENGQKRGLSVDGFVETKIASVGTEVQVMAHTRGHTSQTQVMADILYYPQEPIEFLTEGTLPVGFEGIWEASLTLQQVGAHADDPNTMIWAGSYIVPVNSIGGVFGAKVIAEDGNLRATDDPNQIREVFTLEVENLLQALDDAWDSRNPTMDIQGEFDQLENTATANGGWQSFVDTATDGNDAGDAGQLWNSMIDAGHNQYDMSAGATFLEYLMEFLESEDVDASLAFIASVLIYAEQFPIPRTFEDFAPVVDHIQAFDPIENFTRFEGTGDFEAAYNALLGSNEWVALETAFDNLLNGQKEFEAVQTILHNIALLAVSIHPEAIMQGLEAYFGALMEEDIDNATPFQKLLVGWGGMFEEFDEETDFQDTDGDEIPDEIIFQYEKLLDTPEGQAWTSKMASSASSSYVNDAFNDFNYLPENILEHVIDSIFIDIGDGEVHPLWENVGNTATELMQWMDNASFGEKRTDWHKEDCNSENDDEDDDEEPCYETPYFEELWDRSTSTYDPNLLDIGFRMRFDIESDTGMSWEDRQDKYPDTFNIIATNNYGESHSVTLENNDDDKQSYYGRFTATYIEDAVWSFTQPLLNWNPCNNDDCYVSWAELEYESLRISMLEAMSYWTLDSVFVVSALGVLVDQEETGITDSPYTINTYSYDAFGHIENAEVDIAVIRASPQLAEEAVASLEPSGEVTITSCPDCATSTGGLEFSGYYDGDDLDGDISVRIDEWGDRHDDERYREDIGNAGLYLEKTGSGNNWDASQEVYNHPHTGIVEITTSGNTDSGIEFELWEQIPLPNSPGCMLSEVNWDGGENVNIGLKYKKFFQETHEPEYEYHQFEPPKLDYLTVLWGDGNSDELDFTVGENHERDEWRSHNYGENNDETHQISVMYELDNGEQYWNHYEFREGHGFERTNEEGETWHDWHDRSFEESEWEYCRLEKETNSIPTPTLINSFITDGPVEVVTEVISQSDVNGEASLDITPDWAGAYTSIVQTQYVRNGKTFTGIGLNTIGITDGSVDLGGSLIPETTFAGIPVYSAEPLSSGLMEIEVTPSGISASQFNAIVVVAPLDLSVPFPDIDESIWNEASVEEHTLEFQSGDTSRTQEVRVNAPLSLVLVVIMEGEDSLFPLAMHIGLILTNPESLDLGCQDPLDTSCLGPGQTANVALTESTDTTRILAIAAPKLGFDPASIDLSTFSEFVFGEVRNAELGWVAEEKHIDAICEDLDTWWEERWDDGTQSNVRMRLEGNHNRYLNNNYIYTPNTELRDEDSNLVSPTSDWHKEDWEEGYHANYYLESGAYILTTDSGEIEIEVNPEEYEAHVSGDSSACSGEGVDVDETFEQFSDFFGDLNSVAWGQGTSADLSLPILSAPNVPYTVIGVVQEGTGDSATIVAAFNNCEANECVSEPNPEEITMQNLSVAFTPPNPQIGDTVIISVVDQSGFPVSGLSLIVNGEDGGDTYLTNHNGQVAYIIPEAGTYTIYVGGGLNYNEVTKTIVVTSSGVQEEVVNEDGETEVVELPDGTDITGPIGNTNNTIDEQTNTTTNDETTTNTDDDEDSGLSGGLSSGLGSDMMMAVYAIGLVIIALLVAILVMRLRGRDSNQWDDYDESSSLFDYGDGDPFGSPEPTYTQPQPTRSLQPQPTQDNSRPATSQQGTMRDGYEVIEHPSGSGSWWYRDQSSGQWLEWR